MNLRISGVILAAFVGLAVSAPSHALISCGIDVKDNNGSSISKYVAGRGQSFGSRNVKKYHDCNTCWSGGKSLGPKAAYCGANGSAGDEYVISCNKNSGSTKQKIYQCP